MEKIEITAAQNEIFKKLLEKEEKAKAYARRQAVKSQIILKKAKEAGITATKAEIDAWIEEEDAKKETQASPTPPASAQALG